MCSLGQHSLVSASLPAACSVLMALGLHAPVLCCPEHPWVPKRVRHEMTLWTVWVVDHLFSWRDMLIDILVYFISKPYFEQGNPLSDTQHQQWWSCQKDDKIRDYLSRKKVLTIAAGRQTLRMISNSTEVLLLSRTGYSSQLCYSRDNWNTCRLQFNARSYQRSPPPPLLPQHWLVFTTAVSSPPSAGWGREQHHSCIQIRYIWSFIFCLSCFVWKSEWLVMWIERVKIWL